MSTLWFLLPGPLGQRTGGYLYDARIAEGLRAHGRDVRVEPLPPDGGAPPLAAALAAIPDGGWVVIDGLCLADAAAPFAREAGRLRLVALVHHPAALETGIDTATAARVAAAERAALAHVAQIIVTSRHTTEVLSTDYAVATRRIAVIEPGAEKAPPAVGSGGPGLALVAVGAITPRKGYDILVQALADLPELDWTLAIVGSDTRDADCALALRDTIGRYGLGDWVLLAGERDAAGVAAAYHRADLFVSASHYEGYGMAVGEAVAHGLPIVATAAGAVATTLPPNAGILVPPGDPVALAAALRQVMSTDELREKLAAGARAARDRLPDWPAQSARFAAVLGAIQA